MQETRPDYQVAHTKKEKMNNAAQQSAVDRQPVERKKTTFTHLMEAQHS